MAIPQVEPSAIAQALSEFDKTLRETKEWSRWEENKAQLWAVHHGDRRYPPKKIISLATGLPVDSFSGGPESNTYLESRGFKVGALREVSLSSTFELILDRYKPARETLAFGGKHEIRDLFDQAKRILEGWHPIHQRSHLSVVASYGKGNWATIPWISVLDARETRSTQEGTYAVYLFREDGKGAYLKLAQGVTKPHQEMGARAFGVLEERAKKMRANCSNLQAAGFNMTGESDLGTTNQLARLYEASTIAAKYYPRDSLPDDVQLQADLALLLASYEAIVTSQTAEEKSPSQDTRPLSLLGTWRRVEGRIAEVEQSIRANGGFGSWWSFVVREEARSRLNPPFFLYANAGGGKLVARMRVDDMVTSSGNDGLKCPWPETVAPEFRDVARSGAKQSEIFKTWLKVGDVELLDPPLSVDDFELAGGLSRKENVINQNSFGYLIEESSPTNDVLYLEPNTASTLIPTPAVVPALNIDWLQQRTGLQKDFLVELVDAVLGSSPQIMLAGPPGTSKTWLARQLALFLARDRPNHTRLVQFHPSYSYESFIEGLRPVTRQGGVAFELTPGVVLELVGEMQRQRMVNAKGQEFVIVIDEANRANLPRVLGELMFLFEYRDQAVRLQYSGEFQLPSNLRFVATMNTADRSIRSIDVALRRRFDVFEMGPDVDLLEAHFSSGPTNTVADLLDGFLELNRALKTNLDRHHTIGHAFFMRASMDASTLNQIWCRKIFPLIEEFFFDQPDLAAEFKLERFWPSAHGGD